ncbi:MULTISPECIES: ABC transporter ATP-binding protein [unclassified Bradyrhizobium]|uniref:ABC transporter ATP-binding protein n=1 Tax=unclassified Bradyrhizobium TaxID=2631580 RepID=UPI002447A45E|nr:MULTISPECIES: ABC transporter ATP-binding protein [unclassified Bradyrhizobium]MDH2344018.1 ABC transporter ATP-binding protein [Bradyrhizobium sp. SSUT77]MDH2350389.1 ABC transporter ATP-binding protein [Bradyrhizobium sp. SSUT112]
MNVAPRLTGLAGDKASPTLLELDHVSISYPTSDGILTAVEDVSFRISAGERLVLLGPSGCGKSTLLRAVGGFLKPSAGEVRMNDRRIGAPGPDRMTVFQEFDQLLPWRTVLGNVRYALERGKALSRRDAEQIARRWLERVGLKNFVDAFPHTLSGGMKQRVAIARAFALEPALLLMDEPFAALDALTRRQMQDELLRLCEETRNTALFVTHGIDEAIRVGTRILALTPHPGRLAATFDVLPETRARGTAGFGELERRIQETVFAGPEIDHV